VVTFRSGTFVLLFRTSGHVDCHENTEDEWYVVIKAYKFTAFETSFILFVLPYIACLR